MKILVSKYAGFCGGVKAAVMMLERALRKDPERSLKVLGQLVHNKQVNQDFKDRGVVFIETQEEMEAGDLVFIRAHGTPAETYDYMNSHGIEYVDATCYKVKNTREMVIDLEKQGWQIAVYGEHEHPETIGLVGHAQHGFAINQELLDQIPDLSPRVALLCQSTANRQEFQEIAAFLRERCDELLVNPTFCDFTVDAQNDARTIKDEVEVMLVIGGENSSNTCRLQEICEESIPSYHIQTPEQIQQDWIQGRKCVGITAGASTPQSLISEVVELLKAQDQDGFTEEVLV